MRQEFEVPSEYSPVATPYKWEATPGRPIVLDATRVEPWTSPLRPPPGARSAISKPSVNAFDGFEPEPPVATDTELAGKILKKLNRLRKKSVAAGACFTSDASQHRQRLVAMADVDSESAVRGCSIQPNTPHYSTSIDSSFTASIAAVPTSPCAWPSSSHRRSFEDDGEGLGDGDATLPLPGPSESAWHQPHGHGDETSSVPPQKWQMRRSYGDLVSAFLRPSTPSRSFKSLILVRAFGKSKAAKRLDFRT